MGIKFNPKINYKKALEGFLIPQVDINEWIKQYNIEVKLIVCQNCSTEKFPHLPIASKKYRGFIYETCECDQSPPFAYVDADPEERRKAVEFFYAIKEALSFTSEDP